MKNNFSSLHTHTVFCDGKDNVETMCRTAFEKGLSAIGFSAHAPVCMTGLESNWHMKSERMGEYIEEVNAAKKRWQGMLSVYLGLEVDYIKGLRSALDSDIQSLNFDCMRGVRSTPRQTPYQNKNPEGIFDYIIGSVHYLFPPRGEPFTVDSSAEELEKGITEGYGAGGEAMMNAYWDAIAEMVALGGIDIIGHMDIVKKNNRGSRFFNTDETYMRRAEEIVSAISGQNLAVEVNTGMLNRGHFAEPCPSPEILRLLLKHNVQVIITSDAHKACDLDGNYETARQTLLDAGFTSHALYDGKINGKPVWRPAGLFS